MCSLQVGRRLHPDPASGSGDDTIGPAPHPSTAQSGRSCYYFGRSSSCFLPALWRSRNIGGVVETPGSLRLAETVVPVPERWARGVLPPSIRDPRRFSVCVRGFHCNVVRGSCRRQIKGVKGAGQNSRLEFHSTYTPARVGAVGLCTGPVLGKFHPKRSLTFSSASGSRGVPRFTGVAEPCSPRLSTDASVATFAASTPRQPHSLGFIVGVSDRIHATSR